MENIEQLDQINFWPELDRRPEHVLAAMSGGVDSAFTAWAIKRSGARVTGIHFKMGDFAQGDDGPRRCCSLEDARDARKVAAFLDIPFYVVDLEDEFKRRIVDPFAKSYARGLTPNPCVWCNPRIKWKTLVRKAREIGADAVATGHHCRVVKEGGRVRLLRGLAKRKEQSYFLSMLDKESLAMAVLPAGHFEKDFIRELLREAGLPVADKEESQDLCFVDSGGYQATVDRLLGGGAPKPGDIVDLCGKPLGRHPGIHYFTIGQRKGLNVAASEPLFVVSLDPDNNRVVVGRKEDTYVSGAMADDLHWINHAPDPGREYEVRIRYKSAGASCHIELDGGRMKLAFHTPQRSVAPGQAAVVYDGDEVLGGGFFVGDSRRDDGG